ncbi:MAG: diacylglycerol kinase [Thiotrichales bacterium]|nr:MAG: diacylglycerol kinase [Thiotrichales bacterium]
MGKTGATGLKRIINATGYSWLGLKAAYKHESAFRQELWLAIIMVPLGLYLGQDWTDKAALACSVLFVLVVELLNSAIEAVVDRFGDEPHTLSGRAKDMGSAAVFISLIITAIVWAAVLIENPPVF